MAHAAVVALNPLNGARVAAVSLRMARRRTVVAALCVILAACASASPDPGEMWMSECAPPSGNGNAAADAGMAPGVGCDAATRFVPVLLFHSVCADACAPEDLYGIAVGDLRSLLADIDAAGYRTVTSADYVRAIHGERANLPQLPILLTFDDGREDAYQGADTLLRDAHAVATMFVITDRPDARQVGFMSWAQIESAATSGRWDIQLHAAGGHVEIPVGAVDGGNATAPFYANRIFDPAHYPAPDHLEPRDAWEVRVGADLGRGIVTLRQHLGRFEPVTFAVPFGDYGQVGSNDPTLHLALRTAFDTAFAAWFTQASAPQQFVTNSHERARYTVERTTRVSTIMSWLAASRVARQP